MANQTTNYLIDRPTIDGDPGVWDTILNTAIQSIDTQMKANDDAAVAAQATADAALPKAGGTMTGEVSLEVANSARVDLGNVGALAINLDNANAFTATATSTVTVTVTKTAYISTAVIGFVLLLTNGGSQTVNWPASFNWASGTAPTLTTSGKDLIVGICLDDAGTDFYVSVMKDVK